MWQLDLSHVTRDRREQFVIAPHHPDRLRRPAVPLGATAAERFQHALTWNTFRTLELLAPSFWLRRFHIRLTGEPSIVPPQIVRVHLWQHLPLPPVQRIDGEKADVVADVVVETEHAVWTLVAQSARIDLTDSSHTAAVADAGGWFAGSRDHYCGVIESSTHSRSLGSVLRSRHSRSRGSARLQSATRGPTALMHVLWGAIQWSELAALLRECCEAANLPPIQRALANNAFDWLTAVGIDPQHTRRSPATLSG
jgi:hypothetical protein